MMTKSPVSNMVLRKVCLLAAGLGHSATVTYCPNGLCIMFR